MLPNEPDAEVWRRLFASLTGNSAVDAAMVREFCATYRVTPAEVMAEMRNYPPVVRQAE
jgi:hypothetical protein